MTYTIDNLPAKLYFKIIEDNNPNLLTTENTNVSNLWNDIYDQVSKLSNNKSSEEPFNLGKQIQELSVKIEAVTNAVFYLRRKRDQEIESVLKSYKYTLTDVNFQKDLDTIQRLCSNMEVKIARYQKDLEKYKASPTETQTFEDIYFSYCSIAYAYKTVDSIFIKEFFALEKQVINKIKSIKNNG
jgi:hypothetical protein